MEAGCVQCRFSGRAEQSIKSSPSISKLCVTLRSISKVNRIQWNHANTDSKLKPPGSWIHLEVSKTVLEKCYRTQPWQALTSTSSRKKRGLSCSTSCPSVCRTYTTSLCHVDVCSSSLRSALQYQRWKNLAGYLCGLGENCTCRVQFLHLICTSGRALQKCHLISIMLAWPWGESEKMLKQSDSDKRNAPQNFAICFLFPPELSF